MDGEGVDHRRLFALPARAAMAMALMGTTATNPGPSYLSVMLGAVAVIGAAFVALKGSKG